MILRGRGRMTISKRRSAAVALATGLSLIGIISAVAGQQPTPAPSPLVDDEALGVRFPQTAEDHLAVAEEYVAKAVERKKDADLHRRMLVAYERLAADVARLPVRPGKRVRPPKDALSRYRTHCEGYIRGAKVMADEAERLAEFHRGRAAELRKAKNP